jgi:hypothetical protein
MREEPGDDGNPKVPEEVIDPVEKYGVKARIGKEYLKTVARRRVVFENCSVISPYCAPEAHDKSYYTLNQRRHNPKRSETEQTGILIIDKMFTGDVALS